MRATPWLLAALALTAALPACASRPVATPEAAALAAQDSVLDWAVLYEPLPGGAVRFALARSAYVAVFAIAPGEGVRLLYPVHSRQNVRLDRGAYTRTTRRGVVSAPRLARLNAGYVPEVRYLYLIASSRPLRLDEPLRWPDGGRFTGTSVGGVPFDPQSQDVERTMEVLFDLVVPDADFAEVDTDVYAYYPDVRFRRGGRTYALSAFRCYDGRVVYAPSYYGDGYYGRGYADASYFPSDWFGVDFFTNQYVGSSCYLGYLAGGQPTGGGTLPTGPTTPAAGQLRGNVEAIEPRDIRPHIPLDPGQLRPVVPEPGSGTTNELERAGPALRESPARIRPRPPEGRPEAQPEPMSLPREDAPVQRSEPRGEPRMRPVEREPAHAEPVRPEPVRPEPVRSEPVRSEPVRSEPVRSEPVRSEPVRSAPRHPEPAPSNPDPGAR